MSITRPGPWIAGELGVHGETVGRYVSCAGPPKPAGPAPIGIDPSKPASNAPAGSPSVAAAWRDVIRDKLDQGLTAQRIYQDLVSDHGYGGSYYSVRRLIRKLSGGTPAPFRRMECEPAAVAARQRFGPNASAWSASMLRSRGIEGVRVLMGLLSLGNKYPWHAVDEACRVAHSHGTYRLRCVRKLIEQQPGEQQTQTMMPFIAEHPIIRPVDEYGQWIKEAPITNNTIQPGVPDMRSSLQESLKTLRLSGLAASLDIRLTEARGNHLEHEESWSCYWLTSWRCDPVVSSSAACAPPCSARSNRWMSSTSHSIRQSNESRSRPGDVQVRAR